MLYGSGTFCEVVEVHIFPMFMEVKSTKKELNVLL